LPANLIANTPSITGLATGIHTVQATEIATGCKDTEEIIIVFGVFTPSLTVAAIGNLTDCRTANGSVSVNVVPDAPSDYTFTWYIGSSVGTTPDFPETGPTLTGLTVGTYTVQAIHNTKHCTTAPVTATVLDATPTIDIQQRSSVQSLPTDCNSSNGTLGVEVTAAGNTGGFSLEWFKDNAATPFFTQTTLQFSTATGLGSGNYTVRATNLDNGCVASRTFALPFADAHKLKLITKTDASTCVPQNEGSIIVQLVPTSLVIVPPITVADYELFIYDGKDNSGTLIQQVTGSAGTPVGDSSNFTFNTLSPGFYTLIAIEDNPLLSGCESVPIVVEILPFGDPPVITASTTTNNTSCAGLVLPTGRIVAVADNAPPAGYDFDWFDGPHVSSPVLTTVSGVNNSEAITLPGGLYTVRVTNSSTQCSSTNTFSIFDNPPTITIANTGLDITNITDCMVTTGSAELTAILENTIAASLTDYTVEWFDSNMGSLGNVNPITNLVPGNYFLRATSTTNNCATQLRSFIIVDETIGTVGVDLTSFTNITQCLKPNDVQGELVINPTGTSTSGFSIQWHTGSTVTPAATLAGETTTTLAGISTAGNYTVNVTNNDNNCSVAATYTLTVSVIPVPLTASAASPMTSCSVPNGQLFATVTNGFSNDYTYTWRNASGALEGTGKQLFNRGVGTYTVTAVDNLLSGCIAGPLTVVIDEGRTFPVATAAQVAPLTACTAAFADGIASASVSGNVVDYTFDWYVGTAVAGAPFYTGAQAGGLSDVAYTVRAIHILTGCFGDASVTISRNLLTTPDPIIEILSHITQCDPTIETGNNIALNNGALAASVNGNTSDYIFTWNTGAVGEIYDSLAANAYTVTATDRKTGCISNLVRATVLEELVIPEFEFSVLPATCEAANGYAALEITNNITISEIRWDVGGNYVFGPILTNAEEGSYPVLVRSSEGCYATGEAVVGTEIRPFNGVSRGNGNVGQNDIFKIACIESFATNFVKIFNRAGTLVYEAEGYDNIDVYFDGKSNKGISPLGNNLPDGTYFYVIDKNDGSKPLAGYLEIVN
jgi:large repetitive protein